MGDLRVAVVHYHLRGGGATRVISLVQAEIERTGIQTVVISGESPADLTQWAGRNPEVVPDLCYTDSESSPPSAPDTVLTDLLDVNEPRLGEEA